MAEATIHNYVYVCKCGCNISFIDYSLGWDMYFKNNESILKYIFTENRMVDMTWNEYIDINKFKTWDELWSHILENKDVDNIMLHLYNQYKIFEDVMPQDTKLILEYIY